MMSAWNKAVALALVALPLACELTVTDDPIGPDAGDEGGSGGSAGTGGSSAGIGGSSAGTGGGGTGGSGGEEFPAPTCDAQVGDDECITCLKQQCCNAWLACNDFTCEAEWQGVAACVDALDFPDETDFGMCVSDNAEDMSLGALQQNSNELIVNCANEPSEADAGSNFTKCGVPCFGSDIFFE